MLLINITVIIMLTLKIENKLHSFLVLMEMILNYYNIYIHEMIAPLSTTIRKI